MAGLTDRVNWDILVSILKKDIEQNFLEIICSGAIHILRHANRVGIF